MKIAIIDYQAGNLRNVQKALESLGATTDIVSSPEKLSESEAIILPGVGSFQEGMSSIQSSGLASSICDEVQEKRKPLMGICLGMQLMSIEGEEGGKVEGLGLLPMKVKKFKFEDSNKRIPHMGWNNISLKESNSILFNGVPKSSDFYFAHSYHVVSDDNSLISATCNYGYTFGVAVERNHIFGTQFHPEKSQRYGYKVLSNFMNFCNQL